MFETILVTVAVCIGFIGGALARQPKLRELQRDCATLSRQCLEVWQINQQLGRAMEAAGLDVARIGDCQCGECQTEAEWPDALEVSE